MGVAQGGGVGYKPNGLLTVGGDSWLVTYLSYVTGVLCTRSRGEGFSVQCDDADEAVPVCARAGLAGYVRVIFMSI